METIARLRGDLAHAIASSASSSSASSSSAAAAAAAAVGQSPYSRDHDVTLSRADDASASGVLQRMRCDV
jgi:hypothetical protein